MKRIILSVLVVAAGLMAASCQVSEAEPQAPETVADEHTVTFTSSLADTKTTMSEGAEYAEFSWGAEDNSRFHVYENGYPATKTDVSIVGDVATVTASFTNRKASSYTYTAYVNGSESLVVPSAQTLAEGAYDENAELLVADPVTAAVAPQSMIFSFRRATSTVKMTLKGLESGEVVSKVVVSSAESQLAGSYDKSSGHFVDGTRSITLEGGHVVADASGAAPVFFMCTPAESATLSFEVTTDRGVYRKTLSKALEFPQRTVVRFGVGLSGFAVKPYYEKVTSAPTDWSGTYLIVVETSMGDTKGTFAFNGGLAKLDVASNCLEVEVKEDRIESGESVDAAVFTIDAVDGGYSVKSASGYYIGWAGTKNGMTADATSALLNTISIDSDNFVYITGTAERCLKFNYYTDNGFRFRYYQKDSENAEPVYLFRLVYGGSSEPSTPIELPVTVTVSDATSITSASAVLNGTYSDVAVGGVRELGFEWGTSPVSFPQSIVVDRTFTSSSDTFSAEMKSLSPNTTYYYRAYVLTTDLKYYYSEPKSFTTSSYSGGGSDTSDPDAYAGSWLSNYEIPATDVALSKGRYYHGRVAETYGDTYAYYYTPASKSSSQRIVTHTFLNTEVSGSKVMRNYTILYDYNLHAALWCAFSMNADVYPKRVSRNDAFTTDPAIPSDVQPNSSYDGYDRGHQVASADRLTTAAQNRQTFYYSNMTPQLSGLNQKTWVNDMEQPVQTLGYATTGRDTLYVVTGCIFENTDTKTQSGSLTVPVPTKYYRCIMKCTFNTSGVMMAARGAGYLFEHASSAPRRNVTIDYLEQLTGFDFFANVPESLQNAAESTSYTFF